MSDVFVFALEFVAKSITALAAQIDFFCHTLAAHIGLKHVAVKAIGLSNDLQFIKHPTLTTYSSRKTLSPILNV